MSHHQPQSEGALLAVDHRDLNGVGDRFNGHAFVSGISHSIGQGTWETDIQIGANPVFYSNLFEDIDLSVKKVKIKILIIIAKLRNQTLAMQVSFSVI